MTAFNYSMLGSASGDQTWEAKGTLHLDAGAFGDAFNLAMVDCFMKLTKGEAVFGQPGVGCNGPYKVRKFSIEERTQ